MYSAARIKELSIAKNKIVTRMIRATMKKAFTREGLRKGQTPRGCENLDNLVAKWPEVVGFINENTTQIEYLRTCDYINMDLDGQSKVNQECKILFNRFRKVIEFGNATGHVQTQLNVPKNIISDLNSMLKFMRDQQGKPGGNMAKPASFPKAGSKLPSDVDADAEKEGTPETGESAATWQEMADEYYTSTGHRPETQDEFDERHRKMNQERYERAAKGLWTESADAWNDRFDRQRGDAMVSHSEFQDLLNAAGTNFEDVMPREQRQKMIMMWCKHELITHTFMDGGDADFQDFKRFYANCWDEQAAKMRESAERREQGQRTMELAEGFRRFKEERGYTGESRWISQEANIDYLFLFCYVLVSSGVVDPKEVVPALNSLAQIAANPMGNKKIKEAMQKCHRTPKVQIMASKIDFDREGMYQKYASPMLITPNRFMNGVGIYMWAVTPMNLLEALLSSPPERASQILVVFWRLDRHYDALGLSNPAMYSSTHVAHKLFVGVSAGAFSGNKEGRGTDIKFMAIEDIKSDIPSESGTSHDPDCLKEFLDKLTQ